MRVAPGEVLFAYRDISVAGHAAAALAIEGFVVGLVGAETVDIAVVHAEGRGDQHGIVNLNFGCAMLARGFDIGTGDQLAILLDLTRNDQQRLELGADVGLREVGLDLLHQRLVAAQVGRGNGAVNAVAIVGAVAAGDVGGDQLALAAAERAGPGEQDFDEGVQRPCRLWTEGHGAANAG